MIVRIDTTNLTKGREFTLYADNTQNAPVVIRCIEIVTGTVTTLSYVHANTQTLDTYTATAPQIDGYLIAEIATQKIAKKIGNPLPAFVIGYKVNYTVPYKALDANGVELGTGDMIDVGNGFYYTLIPQDTVVVEAIGKRFIVNKNLLKMNYDVTISGGTLNSTYDTPIFDNAVLPNVTLPANVLGNATLDAAMPNVTITEL